MPQFNSVGNWNKLIPVRAMMQQCNMQQCNAATVQQCIRAMVKQCIMMHCFTIALMHCCTVAALHCCMLHCCIIALTGISLFQFPTELNCGISQGVLQLSTASLKKLNWPNFPDYYYRPAVVLKREDISTIPKLSNSLPMIGNSTRFDKAMAKEKA